MFCRLLRKHLTGGIIRSFEQPPMERVLRMRIDAVDELGQHGKRSLVLETMGRRSNLILLDGDDLILDCLRKVDFETSQTRQVLPGMRYVLPENNRKMLSEIWETDGQEDEPLSERLLGFSGVSPLLAREISFRATGSVDTCIGEMDARQFERANDLISDFVKEKDFAPFLLKKDGKTFDFSCFPVLQYGLVVLSERKESFSNLLDGFYEEKERRERVSVLGRDILQCVTAARERLARKLVKQRAEYAKTAERDRFRRMGELLTANLYRVKKGETCVSCEDYYQPDCPTVVIPLDAKLSPQENAEKYFKSYRKLKTAEQVLGGLLESGEAELRYLEGVFAEIGRAETEQDFYDIREELTQEGYIRRRQKEKKTAGRKNPYMEFKSRNGLTVLAGRNHLQNDRLTLHDAGRYDVWFHVQGVHGAHVLLRDGENASEEDLYDAAVVAARYSEAAASNRVPVDYTPVRYVKKPSGARPGQVIYKNFRTLFVSPTEGNE